MKQTHYLFDYDRDHDMTVSHLKRLILRPRARVRETVTSWELEGRGRNEVTLFVLELQARSDALEIQRVLFPEVQVDFV